MRWMRVAGAVLLAVMCAVVTPSAARADEPPIFDKRPYKDAKAAATKDKRWFIVKGTAEWCGPCKQMDKTTWRDEKVVKWLEANAVVVAVDVDDDKKLAQELGIRAMPTMIAFKGGTEEFDRIVGGRGPGPFLGWLEGMARGEKSGAQPTNPGGKPAAGGGEPKDPKAEVEARYQKAQDLTAQRRYAGATADYLWLWDNIAQQNPAMQGVRVSFMANQMKELAKLNAEAMTKFKALRDGAAKLAEAKPTDEMLAGDLIVLNEVVGDDGATLAWFDQARADKARHETIHANMVKLRDVIKRGERMADVGALIENAGEALDRDIKWRTSLLGKDKKNRGGGKDDPADEAIHELFRSKCAWTYACLLAADRENDAKRVAARARKEDDDPKMVEALVRTALEAGLARQHQMEWLGRVRKGTLDDLKKELAEALEKSKDAKAKVPGPKDGKR